MTIELQQLLLVSYTCCVLKTSYVNLKHTQSQARPILPHYDPPCNTTHGLHSYNRLLSTFMYKSNLFWVLPTLLLLPFLFVHHIPLFHAYTSKAIMSSITMFPATIFCYMSAICQMFPLDTTPMFAFKTTLILNYMSYSRLLTSKLIPHKYPRHPYIHKDKSFHIHTNKQQSFRTVLPCFQLHIRGKPYIITHDSHPYTLPKYGPYLHKNTRPSMATISTLLSR